MCSIDDAIRYLQALQPAADATPEVKRCPFCGGHATVEETAADIGFAWVECDRCGARTRKHFGQDKADRAITAWNRRPDTEE
jgi:Lar family restriction alleviation protein